MQHCIDASSSAKPVEHTSKNGIGVSDTIGVSIKSSQSPNYHTKMCKRTILKLSQTLHLDLTANNYSRCICHGSKLYGTSKWQRN